MRLHPPTEIVIHHVPNKHRLGPHSNRNLDFYVGWLGETKGNRHEHHQGRSCEAGTHISILAPPAVEFESSGEGAIDPSRADERFALS